MTPDALLGFILLVGWLVLVGTGIRRRGEPISRLAWQAASWVLIIGVMWAIATFGLKLGRP